MAAPIEAAAHGRPEAALHRRRSPEVVSAASRMPEDVYTVTAPSGSMFRACRRGTVRHHTYDDHHVEVQYLEVRTCRRRMCRTSRRNTVNVTFMMTFRTRRRRMFRMCRKSTVNIAVLHDLHVDVQDVP